jgi:hypothetical protein
MDVIVREITKFVTAKSTGPEKVEKAASGGRAR